MKVVRMSTKLPGRHRYLGGSACIAGGVFNVNVALWWRTFAVDIS